MGAPVYDRIMAKQVQRKKASAKHIYNIRKQLGKCVGCGGDKETPAVRCNACLQMIRQCVWRSHAKKQERRHSDCAK